ncbi:MAG TPA: hypothetical protein VKR06_05255 [Ktedonosporobacter sp.]|nr:hypothetical protein [Ktedonosporobacter sp.]
MNEVAPTKQVIEEMLARLNEAQARFYAARGRIEKNAADEEFQETWDWFRDWGIKLRQEVGTRGWVVVEGITLYIGRNTYTLLLAELERHGVLIRDVGDRLMVRFPEGTRKELQPDGPRSFLLTLPDGWTIQELELYRSRLPYSSILVYGPDQEVPDGGMGVSWRVGYVSWPGGNETRSML